MRTNSLYRSPHNKIIAGVLGGIAARFGWNATILRIIFVLITVFSSGFPGVLVYLILWFVMPKPNLTISTGQQTPEIRTVHNEQDYRP